MKLRIQGNSLRLRLTQKEVAQVRNLGIVESHIEFAPGHSLSYLLQGSSMTQTMCATFDGRTIRVTIPMHEVTDWVESDQTGIETQSQTGVQLLIEKDFKCLHRPIDQEPDAYPHPLMT
ncbi:MAG: hypothetical protein ABSG03_26770 [Bryobacteraceae bacterium]